MNRLKNSLLAKRILLSTTIIFFLVGILSAVSYYQSSKAIAKEIEAQLEAQLHELAYKISMEEEILEDEINLLAKIDDICNYHLNDGDTIQAFLQDFASTKEGSVEHLFITDPDGSVIYDNVDGELKGTDLSDRAYFKEGQNGNSAWSDIIISRFSSQDIIVYSTPLITKSGDFQGVLAVTILFDHIADLIHEVHVGEMGYAYMLDSNGNFIVHPTESLLGVHVSGLSIPELTSALDDMTAGGTGEIKYT